MKKVCIDPGHGVDPGAVFNGIIEKNINLIVALKLKELLLSKGFEVLLTRETDISVSLTERCNIANNWGADIFISVHHNASGCGADGYEIIHTIHTGISLGDELANCIAVEFSNLGQNCRKVYSRESMNYLNQDFFTTIQKTKMPSIISEFAFIDSKDSEIINTTEKLHDEAIAIFKGICRFYNIPLEQIDPLRDALKFLASKSGISEEYWYKEASLNKTKWLKECFIKLAKGFM